MSRVTREQMLQWSMDMNDMSLTGMCTDLSNGRRKELVQQADTLVSDIYAAYDYMRGDYPSIIDPNWEEHSRIVRDLEKQWHRIAELKSALSKRVDWTK